MGIGDQVRKLRLERHLSMTSLARRSGMTTTGVSLVERGIRSPTSETVEKLARGLGVAPGDLYPPKAPAPKKGQTARERLEELSQSGVLRFELSIDGGALQDASGMLDHMSERQLKQVLKRIEAENLEPGDGITLRQEIRTGEAKEPHVARFLITALQPQPRPGLGTA